MAYGIRKQIAPFLKRSRLRVGAPVHICQYGDQKTTAVRTQFIN